MGLSGIFNQVLRMVGDVIVDELEAIGVDFAKEPAGVEIGLFTQAPAQLGGEWGRWGPH